MQVRTARLALPYAVVVTASVAVHAAAPPSVAWLPYLLVSVVATVAAAMGLLRHRPPDPLPWRLLVIGLTLSFLGSALWYALDHADRDTSITHAVYLSAYVFSVVAAWRIGRHRPDAERTVTWLDTAIVTTGAAILMWVFVAGPTWSTSPLVGAERVVRTVYPMINLAMLAAVLRLSFGGAARVRAHWLLIAGLAGLYIADLLFAVTALYGAAATTASGTIRLVGLGLIGAAAMHLSMREVGAPGPPAHVELSRLRLLMLWMAAAAAPVALVIRLRTGAGLEHGVVIALGSLVLFTLVLVRMWGLLRMLAAFVEHEHEDRFRALVENADDVILIVDDHGTISYVSPSCQRIWGYPAERVVEDGWRAVARTDRARLLTAIGELGEEPVSRPTRIAGRLRHADGGWRRVEATLVDRRADRAIGGIVITARDVTTRVELEEQLAHRTFHDPLTGLPNRALFADRVHQAIGPTRGEPIFAAVLFLDIDDFKGINDTLGHELGDELLQVIGRRLAAAVRPQDTVARLGGDEFGILVPEVASLHEVTGMAARLLEDLSRPVTLARASIEVRASLGIATSSVATSAHDLLRDADAAMYGAKREDRGSFRLFDPAMHAEAVQRLQLKMDLRSAVDRGELEVVYQPIHELDGETMVAMEALLRWHHPTRGLVSPIEFIPLSEESGSIGLLGEFVLRRACADVASYRAASGQDVSASVNVSPLQLYDPAFARTVTAALDESGLPRTALTLELTESIFLEQSEEIHESLDRLSRVGVRLAIDDFGTGYCSLGYLNRFRFDLVKIDKSFIDVLASEDGDRRLTIGMMELIGSLEVPAVAEGVETPEQLNVLRAVGCPYGQGYLWSRPVPIDEVPLPQLVPSRALGRGWGGALTI